MVDLQGLILNEFVFGFGCLKGSQMGHLVEHLKELYFNPYRSLGGSKWGCVTLGGVASKGVSRRDCLYFWVIF